MRIITESFMGSPNLEMSSLFRPYADAVSDVKVKEIESELSPGSFRPMSPQALRPIPAPQRHSEDEIDEPRDCHPNAGKSLQLEQRQHEGKHPAVAARIRGEKSTLGIPLHETGHLGEGEPVEVHPVVETPAEGHVDEDLPARLQDAPQMVGRGPVVLHVFQDGVAIDRVEAGVGNLGVGDVVHQVGLILVNDVGAGDLRVRIAGETP